MDPPTSDDDDNGSEASFARRHDETVEAAARRRRREQDGCSSESDNEFYDEPTKNEKATMGESDNSNSDSDSDQESVEATKNDPPAASPPIQLEGNPTEAAAVQTPGSALAPRTITYSTSEGSPNDGTPSDGTPSDGVTPQTTDPTPPSDGTRGQRKERLTPSSNSTSRKAKPAAKKKSKVRIGIGCRVKTSREKLYHIAPMKEQSECLKKFENNSRNMHGVIISGDSKTGHTVEFDDLPFEYKTVKVRRNNLETAAPGEEEPEYDRVQEERQQTYEEVQQKKKTAREKNPLTVSEEVFKAMKEQDKADAKVHHVKYGAGEDDVVHWKILSDLEDVDDEDDPMKGYKDKVNLKKDFDFNTDPENKEGNEDLSRVFFDNFFASIEGHAKLIDEFHSDMQSHWYDTVKKEKIQFHDPEADDPDWIVKQCYLLMIAAVCEADTGCDNLWKDTPSGRRKPHANFKQCLPLNYFKAFMAAAPFVFADKSSWHDQKRDRRWSIFTPLLKSFNKNRRALFEISLLMLDESMSGWKPKTSKRGGPPNISSEPRKPCDLGTLLRNAVECITGVLAYQDVSMNPEVQDRKEFFFQGDPTQEMRESSHLPKNENIDRHVAEVLRQVKGSELKEGGWVGGDAWFGSVMSSVELMNRMKVHSTFVIKNNDKYFPKGALHEVLLARHGKRPAGHWAVMRTEIAEVKLTAIACAWSQKNVACFITTCGSTKAHKVKYQSKFENECGEVDFKEINRPTILHFLYENLPLIDEHNKQRQSVLQLEKLWLTKNCWFRLLTTLLGQSVVDFHRIYRCVLIGEKKAPRKIVDSVNVVKFTDMMSVKLKPWPEKKKGTKKTQEDLKKEFERICNEDGTYNRNVTEKQSAQDRTVGNSQTLTCFMCRSYINPTTNKGYANRTTSFWCRHCKMPLCKGPDRTKSDPGRTMTCMEEHMCTEDPYFACGDKRPHGEVVKDEKKRNVAPRMSQRNINNKRKRSSSRSVSPNRS